MAKTEPIQNVIDSVEQLAQALIERRMETPAIFALELSKPLVGCIRELYGVTEGLQRALFGSEVLPVLREVLSSTERVEALIVMLERSRNGVPTRVSEA